VVLRFRSSHQSVIRGLANFGIGPLVKHLSEDAARILWTVSRSGRWGRRRAAVDPCKIDVPGSTPGFSTNQFRSSTPGERARLLTENEGGSNPPAGANARSSSKAGHQPLKLGNAGSNPRSAAPICARSKTGQCAGLRIRAAEVRVLPCAPNLSGCRGAWPSLPALEAGDRWFESTRPDQFDSEFALNRICSKFLF
jgi:hypothetical protein